MVAIKSTERANFSIDTLAFGNGLLLKLEILQSLGGLYYVLAFYALHWSYAPSL